jgi:hypothetical protein
MNDGYLSLLRVRASNFKYFFCLTDFPLFQPRNVPYSEFDSGVCLVIQIISVFVVDSLDDLGFGFDEFGVLEFWKLGFEVSVDFLKVISEIIYILFLIASDQFL